jgi:6-phosphogluconolactonase
MFKRVLFFSFVLYGFFAAAGTVLHAQNAGFVYIANGGSLPPGEGGTVSAYTIDGPTGALTPIPGSPFPAGIGPTSITVDPAGRFVFVVNGCAPLDCSGSVSAYTIDEATGALSPAPGSPFPAGINSRSVAVDSTGHFAYVANYGSADISAYRIDQESGALAPISGSPISVGGAASSVAADQDAHFVYVAVDLGSGPSQVSGFSIDEKSGDLTPVPGSAAPTEHFPFAITVDPTGNFVYVTCGARATGNPDPTISAYTIDRKTGALTQVSGSPYGVGFPPLSVTVDPTGQFVCVADFLTQSISSFTIDRDNGALAQMLAVPVSGEPRSLAADPSGKFLYVAAFGALGVPSYTIYRHPDT